MVKKYKVADFFCGAGGFSEGFNLAGFEIVFALDKWQPAIETHHMNHPNAKTTVGDVIKISNLPDEEFHALIPDTEIIIGSPPCTFFSNSNKSGKGDKSLGVELIEAYLRIIARKKYQEASILKYWVLENVPNVEKHIKDIYTAEELGLTGNFAMQIKNNSSKVYNAIDFGVASNRKRYMCGEFPEPDTIPQENNNIKTIRDIQFSLGKPKKDTEEIVVDPNYAFSMLSKDITDHHYIKELAEFEWNKAKRLKDDRGYMGKMSFPENLDKPSRTVMATSTSISRESMIYDFGKGRYRTPTVREVASIMSFPIDYRFYGQSRSIKHKLVGNAVPPKMSFAIANAIAKSEGLGRSDRYVPKIFSKENNFCNLNFQEFQINIEKPKKQTARFKDHIPYLKVNGFRVELTNSYSDFDEKDFNWDVEIHKSQGKYAKKYQPSISADIFSYEQIASANKFIQELQPYLVNYNEFQKIYCKTEEDRLYCNEIGPFELLKRVKALTELIFLPEEIIENLTIKEEPCYLPKSILFAYFVLEKIANTMQLQENS